MLRCSTVARDSTLDLLRPLLLPCVDNGLEPAVAFTNSLQEAHTSVMLREQQRSRGSNEVPFLRAYEPHLLGVIFFAKLTKYINILEDLKKSTEC